MAAFLAATVLPFSSEAVLVAMALGPWNSVALWAVASAGNWLGGMVTPSDGCAERHGHP